MTDTAPMSGARLGIDVGRARIGVARCDPHRLLATPLETVKREARGSDDIQRILALAQEYEVVDVVVGLPLNMRGEHTRSTDDAIQFAGRLAWRLSQLDEPIPVRMVDERLSTVSARAQFHDVGRSTRDSRQVIDQAAATVILQQAIDMDRAQGRLTGTLIQPHPPRGGHRRPLDADPSVSSPEPRSETETL